MANPEHLAILEKGVEVWNKWRKENPSIVPDLSEADLEDGDFWYKDKGINLSGADLKKANLRVADLTSADLTNVDLKEANLQRGDLSGANLKEADLSGTDFSGAFLFRANLEKSWLSGCIIDKGTEFRTVQGIELGVNGIYCSDTDSAALMQMMPPGNSMQGSNADAIIESLKHARKLHNISLSFAGIALLIAVLKPESIKIPFFPDFSSEPTHYAVLAIFCSVGILTLTESFIRAALEGARYINDRDSAMKVGHFPWTISKYDKGKWGQWQSRIMRLILCFHPMAYPALYFSVLQKPLSALFPAGAGWFFYLENGFVVLAFLALLVLCGRIFWLSQQFQKPILFDPETERNRKSDAAILNTEVAGLKQQVSRLNKNVTTLIDILKPKESITTDISTDTSTS